MKRSLRPLSSLVKRRFSRVVTILDDDRLSEIFLDEVLPRVEQGSTVKFPSKVGVWKVTH